MEEWLKAGQDKVWNKRLASALVKRFKDERHLVALKMAASLVKGVSVLDVGCGFGQLFQFLPEGTQYLGLEQSEDMLRIARKKFPQAKFTKGNIYAVDLPRFDTVVAMDVLHHQPDLEPMFSKLISVGKKQLIISLWIWGRISRAKKKYVGHYGEIIRWSTTEELEKKFSGLNYKVVRKVGRVWRDIYYFDLTGDNK